MAQNPAFGKLVAQYVSPNISDRIFAEDYEGDNIPIKAITPGQAHPDPKYPNFVLAHQEYIASSKIFRRYWINNRSNEDAYNYSTEFPYYGLNEFPRYTRTYVIRRSEYDATSEKPATDPVFTDAVFVSESQTRFDERILDNLYVFVTRVFDVVPNINSLSAIPAGPLTEVGYALSFPEENKDKAQVTWRFPFSKDSYERADNFSPCPITGFNDAVLVAENAAPKENDPNQLFVTRVYSVLPGAPVVSYQTNQAKQKVTVTSTRKNKQAYLPPAASATRDVSVTSDSDTLVVEQINDVDSVFPGKVYSAQKSNLIPAIFRTLITERTYQETVAGTASQPTLTGNQRAKSEQQIDLYTKRVSTTIRDTSGITLPISFDSLRIVPEYGICRESVTFGEGALQQPEEDFKVLQDRTDNLGNGEWVNTHLRVVGDFPTLRSSELDPVYLVATTTERQVVRGWVPGTGLPRTNINAVYQSNGIIEEYQAIDKYRSIYVKRRLKELPEKVTLPSTRQISFPPVMKDYQFNLEYIGNKSYSSSTSYSQSFNETQDTEGDEFKSRSRTYSRSSVRAPAFDYTLTSAYSGNVRARTIESFSYDIPAYPFFNKFRPNSGTFSVARKGGITGRTFVNGVLVDASFTGSTFNSRNFSFPSCLHPLIEIPERDPLSEDEFSDQDYMQISKTIPETLPPKLPTGWITVDFDVQRWKFGAYRIIEIQVRVPNLDGDDPEEN